MENDISRLHVVGTARIAARLGFGPQAGLVLAAPRRYRIRGELVTLPQVVGTARRPLYSTHTARPQQVASAA